MPALVSSCLPSRTFSGRHQPRLVGSGVTLRPWQDGDVDGLVTACADPDIQRRHCRSLDVEEASDLIQRWHGARQAEGGASWAVVDDQAHLLGRAFSGRRRSGTASRRSRTG